MVHFPAAVDTELNVQIQFVGFPEFLWFHLLVVASHLFQKTFSFGENLLRLFVVAVVIEVKAIAGQQLLKDVLISLENPIYHQVGFVNHLPDRYFVTIPIFSMRGAFKALVVFEDLVGF